MPRHRPPENDTNDELVMLRHVSWGYVFRKTFPQGRLVAHFMGHQPPSDCPHKTPITPIVQPPVARRQEDWFRRSSTQPRRARAPGKVTATRARAQFICVGVDHCHTGREACLLLDDPSRPADEVTLQPVTLRSWQTARVAGQPQTSPNRNISGNSGRK